MNSKCCVAKRPRSKKSGTRNAPPSTAFVSLKKSRRACRRKKRTPTAPGDWEKVGQLRYGRLSQIQKDIEAAQHDLDVVEENPLPQEGNRRGRHRQDRLQVDRHSAATHDGRRNSKARQHERASERPRGRAGRSGAAGVERDSAQPCRAERSQPAHRQLHFPRAHRCRQNRTGARSRTIPIRRRQGDDPRRHVGVRRAPFGRPHDRLASRIRGL